VNLQLDEYTVAPYSYTLYYLGDKQQARWRPQAGDTVSPHRHEQHEQMRHNGGEKSVDEAIATWCEAGCSICLEGQTKTKSKVWTFVFQTRFETELSRIRSKQEQSVTTTARN
jgi:hypothetical protein